MAGHLGQERVTTQNLTVAQVDLARSLIMVHGAIPGSKGDFVLVRDAIKRPVHIDAPFPASLVNQAQANEG